MACLEGSAGSVQLPRAASSELPKLSDTQRRVSVGDVVQWEHFSLETGFRAMGSRDSSIGASAGTVEKVR